MWVEKVNFFEQDALYRLGFVFSGDVTRAASVLSVILKASFSEQTVQQRPWNTAHFASELLGGDSRGRGEDVAGFKS